jgi:hypothetical protein
MEFFKPRLVSSQKRLERLLATLDDDFNQGLLSREEYDLCAERLKNVAQMQQKLQTLVPLAEKLF